MARSSATLIHAFVLLSTLAACVPPTRTARSSAGEPLGLEAPRDYVPSDRILPAEFKRVRGMSAADAVRELRPHFLRAGTRYSAAGVAVAPTVYVNDQYIGGAETLEIIGLQMVLEIRHLDAVTAKSLYGSYCRCDGGVIHVRMRRTQDDR